jgi:COP9 signalosome complex subunit 8
MVQAIMAALREAMSSCAFALVSQAYTSIIANDFVVFVEFSLEETLRACILEQVDSLRRVILSRKPVTGPRMFLLID